VLDLESMPSKHPADHACKHLKKMPPLLCGQARHGRAMQAARTSRRGSREAEAALLSLDALHKQVAPWGDLHHLLICLLSHAPANVLHTCACTGHLETQSLC
jgi:hypothetical protein